MLNCLSPERAHDELGALQFESFGELVRRVFGVGVITPDKIQYRIAPSIICRSECELLAVSAPRFAVRATFPDGSFTNLRRLPFLARSVPNWDTRRRSGTYAISEVTLNMRDGIGHVRATIEENMRSRGRCIADSFLRPSEQLNSDYYFLSTQIGQLYGEAPHQGALPGLVPFIRHIRLGGGMCAQASCFMAACLMYKYIQAIHGIPEITVLARSQSDETLEIDLGGLNRESICNYFTHPDVGLTCQDQRTPNVSVFLPHSCKTNPQICDAFRNRLFEASLRAYVISGFPVIVPVDLGLMARHKDSPEGVRPYWSILERNNISVSLRSKPAYTHAVVAVACAVDNVSEFIINDPATFPFLCANTYQLVQSRTLTFTQSSEPHAVEQSPYVAILPVVPRPVRIPLLEMKRDESHGADIGLLSRQQVPLYQASMPSEVRAALHVLPNQIFDPGDLGLIYFGGTLETEVQRLSREKVIEQILGKESLSDANDVIAGLRFAQALQNRWCWLQRRQSSGHHGSRETIVLWDASDYSNEGAPIPHCALLRTQGGHWEITYLNDSDDNRNDTPFSRVESQEAAPVSAPASNCRASLISSFVMDAPFEPVRQWPSFSIPAEWYVLMQSSVSTRRWKKKMSHIDERAYTAVEWMAAIAENPAAISELARDVENIWAASGLLTVAIASFVPTLSFPPDSPGGRIATQALTGLCRIAHAINEASIARSAQPVQPIGHLEIVAGTRATGIWPGKKRHGGRGPWEDTFVGNLLTENEATDNIVENLEVLMCTHEAASFVWSLELEPGPLFALNTWDCIERLVNRLDSSEKLRGRVGLNLDVAHWRLAFVRGESGDADIVKRIRSSGVFSHICHAHISGHSLLGHFGDLSLRSVNLPDEFLPWIELLKERSQVTSGIPFSGCISLEIEAAKDVASIHSSLADLDWLLQGAHRHDKWPALTGAEAESNMHA
jgi:hypothetical protein